MFVNLRETVLYKSAIYDISTLSLFFSFFFQLLLQESSQEFISFKIKIRLMVVMKFNWIGRLYDMPKSYDDL